MEEQRGRYPRSCKNAYEVESKKEEGVSTWRECPGFRELDSSEPGRVGWKVEKEGGRGSWIGPEKKLEK